MQQQQQQPDEILGGNDAGLDAEFSHTDDAGTSLLYRPFHNPLLSSSAAPDDDSTGLPPLTISEQFSLHAPPTTGYIPGCYLLSPPRPILPPLGHYQTSSIGAYGPSNSFGASSSYTQTSWSNPYSGGIQPLGTPYSNFPGLYGSNYNTLPPPPLSHPTEPDSSLSPTVGYGSRKRRREDEIADSNNPAGAALKELPTPPDSSSDRSGSFSPYRAPTISSQQINAQHSPFPSPPLPQNGVHVTLSAKSEDLWTMFYAANTEMIVTKSGRCLFPVLIFNVHGLSRKKEYNIYVRAVCSDQYRYKYLQNSWTQVSESEFTHDAKKMISKHPSSPQTGTKWMAKDVDFKSLKITHYAKSKGGDILLNTMHKYFFEVVVEENQSDSNSLAFPFDLTRFIAVTAYQSAKLTELKKEKNPFARGVKHHDSDSSIHPSCLSQQYMGYNPNPLYPASTDPVRYPIPWTQPNKKS